MLIQEADRNDTVLVAVHSAYSGFSRLVDAAGEQSWVPLEPTGQWSGAVFAARH